METPEIGSEVWKQIQLLTQPLSLLTQGPRMAMRAARIQDLNIFHSHSGRFHEVSRNGGTSKSPNIRHTEFGNPPFSGAENS